MNDEDYSIGLNLWSFLFRVGHQAIVLPASIPILWLWIDQVSIFQDSDEDKTQQVQRMPDIYKKAFRVIAWLGVEGVHMAETIRFIRKGWERYQDHAGKGRAVRFAQKARKLLGKPKGEDVKGRLIRRDKHYSAQFEAWPPEVRQGFDTFVEVPYWRRLCKYLPLLCS